MTDLLTIGEVAEILKLTPETVRAYITGGYLKAHKMGKGKGQGVPWRIERADLDAYLKSCRKNGGTK